jgi:hypothetical protein
MGSVLVIASTKSGVLEWQRYGFEYDKAGNAKQYNLHFTDEYISEYVEPISTFRHVDATSLLSLRLTGEIFFSLMNQ